MASLPNKQFEYIVKDENTKATYADLLEIVLNVSTDGYRAAELRSIVKALDACEAARETGTLDIPDDALPLVKRIVADHRWAFPTTEAKREVLQFCEDMERL